MTGRPRSFDRDEAVVRALDVFWRDGYRTASVSRLTRRLGINSPSLYAAFGSKRQLFDEASALYARTFRLVLDEHLGAPTARAGVERMLRAFAANRSQPGSPPTCMIFDEPLLAEERARARARIAERIARGRDEGESIDDDPDRLAAFIFTVMAGINARARDGAAPEELLDCAAVAMRAWPSG
jgi:AcrR family transcriptional regulator